MRSILMLLCLCAFPAALAAQATDYGGMRIFTNSAGAPTPLACGTPFSCTPFAFTANAGDAVSAIVLGETNGPYLIAATPDTTNLLCLPLGIPGVVHELVMLPGTIFLLAVGSCSQSDNGRCNGGTSGVVPLFVIPPALPSGSVLFQGLIATPLSAGGSGLAFSNAVVMNW